MSKVKERTAVLAARVPVEVARQIRIVAALRLVDRQTVLRAAIDRELSQAPELADPATRQVLAKFGEAQAR